MSSKTPNIGLIKQAGTEYGDNDITNENLDKIDEEIGKRGKTVNGIAPDEKGDYRIDEVPAARQIVTDESQQSSGEYQFRTTGGDASLSDGDGKLTKIMGRSTHTGIVEESLTLTVNAVAREEGEEPITATIDRDTFVAYVSVSGTTTLEYTDAWSANPSLYGVTVEGTPVDGDEIVIVYVKANRGLITNSAPTRFISTGWNLYNHSAGYARVKKYSDTYGFMIGGAYSAVKFSETLTGSKTTITPVSGKFNIPADGYVWVTDGNNSTTYILMTWSDWTNGYTGDWKAYSESIVNFATVVSSAFPYGMMRVNGVADELDFEFGQAISRIERLTYSAENIAAVEAAGRAYDCDETYIYAVRTTPVVTTMTVSGDHVACDHGEEIVDGGTVAPFVITLYGENLVDKLRTDVVTKSGDLVNGFTETGTGKALDARAGKTLKDTIGSVPSGKTVQGQLDTLNSKITLQYQTVAKENCSYTYDGVLFKKTGGILIVTVSGVISLPAGGATEICTIPSGFVPSTNWNYDAIGVSSNETGANPRIIRMRVQSNGKFTLYNYGAALTNANLTLDGIFVL